MSKSGKDNSIFDSWFDVRKYLKMGFPFNFFLIGRGAGKTYSSIAHITEKECKSLYVRNTERQLDMCMSDIGNPFKKYNRDNKVNYEIKVEGKYKVMQEAEYDADGKPIFIRPIGYGVALSTFENVRGIDMEDVDCIWMEEFIQSQTLMYDQFDAFCKMYETVNRNREVIGKDPVQVIFTANSQSLSNPILSGFGLIPIIEKMDRKGKELVKHGDFLICRNRMSELVEEKRKSVLYRNIKGSAVAAEALDNEFANDSFYNVAWKPIAEYKPICKIDDIYIYIHKTNGTAYACRVRGDCPEFSAKDNYALFMRNYGFDLRDTYARGELYYSEYQIKAKLNQILKL